MNNAQYVMSFVVPHLFHVHDCLLRLVLPAQATYRAKQLPAALDALTELISREPENAIWYERRGQVFVDLKRFQDALSDFDTVRVPENFKQMPHLSLSRLSA